MSGFSEDKALAWAAEHLTFSTHDVVTRHPWARTYRLSDGATHSYLKASFNRHHKGGVHNLYLSALAEGSVPKVLKVNTDQSLILMQDFAVPPCSDALDDAAKARVLAAYGTVQQRAFGHADLAASLPHVTCAGTFTRFLALIQEALSQGRSQANPGNPFAYFSTNSQKGYLSIFNALTPHLTNLFKLADTMPSTINHCDLRPKNVALRDDGSPVIFDWDDAIWAPPGFSLHAQFRGAHRAFLGLSATDGFENRSVTRDAGVLDAYVTALADGPIAPDALKPGLQASCIAGVMHYISAFAPYGITSRTSQSTIKKMVRRRLSNLLDLFGDIAATDRAFAADLARAYRATGRDRRARKALSQWRAADLSVEAARAFDITPTPSEKAAMAWAPDTLDKAILAFRDHGTLVIRDVFDPALIRDCHARFSEDYAGFQQDISKDAALRVGDRRYMVTPALQGALADPGLLASPFILPIMRKLLSDKVILGSVTSVASAPGAKDQSIHRDNPLLFPEDPDLAVPNFLISLIVPLIPLTRDTGSTRLWPGSHKKHYSNYEECPTLDPHCDIGSCYLMDSRLFHQGLANRSDQTRPILAIIYQRPWYVDHKNFKKQTPLRLGDPSGDTLSDEVRELVTWAIH
ncbi:phytanoyl-CoA dioxygenase family protein [Shimia sediminis]|uniref:phytanoyl-CoA dioxygenase family protein n=1 Tax=Shimia sediminis TaxID=2497945 RepID=UPI0013E0AB7B|nr:phytanoyl-CoA dioxygenase family protein [Shimia sediminis]